MRRIGMAVALLALVGATSCGGGGAATSAGGAPSSSAAIPTTTAVPATAAGTTVPPANLTLRIADIRLVNSEESDNGLRVLLPAGVATASVTLTGLPSPNQVISVCQAKELDSRLPGAACRTPANGEAVTITLGAAASGVEVIQVGATGTGAAANSAALDSVSIRYAASTREVNVRLPQVAAGEHPSFGLTPATGAGTYRAALTWTVIPVFGGTPSTGQLQLVQGTAVTDQAQGGAAGVQLSGTVPSTGGDLAIRLQNIGDAALVSPKLAAVLP